MAKLMEIIEKNPNFKNGTTSLKLLDTTFTQLTRKIGSNPEADFKTAKAGDILSKELLVSLNQEQLSLKDKLLLWKDAYNEWINSKKSKVTALSNFEYEFSSLVDYSNKYIPGTTLADYYLLTEVANAEKELYEFGYYWGKNHILDSLNTLKEWSKTQSYGSCVKKIYMIWDISPGGSTGWRIINNGQIDGLDINLFWSPYDKGHLYVSGLQNIKVGETRTLITQTEREDNYGSSYWVDAGELKITRNSLNSEYDDGYYTFNARVLRHGMYIELWPRVEEWTGEHSPHFDNDNPTLPWIKNRVLL